MRAPLDALPPNPSLGDVWPLRPHSGVSTMYIKAVVYCEKQCLDCGEIYRGWSFRPQRDLPTDDAERPYFIGPAGACDPCIEKSRLRTARNELHIAVDRALETGRMRSSTERERLAAAKKLAALYAKLMELELPGTTAWKAYERQRDAALRYTRKAD